MKNPPEFRTPDWVNWLAQDADGVWWGFEHEPNQHHQGWYENELGRCILLRRAAPNPDWKESLGQRAAGTRK